MQGQMVASMEALIQQNRIAKSGAGFSTFANSRLAKNAGAIE